MFVYLRFGKCQMCYLYGFEFSRGEMMALGLAQ